MRRRFLHWLAVFLFRRAWLMLPLLLVSVGISAWLVQTRTTLDTSLIAFLPPSSEHEQKIREIVRDYRNLEPVVVIIHAREPGHEQALRDMVRIFADDYLDYRSYFYHPVYKTDEVVESYFQSLPNSRLIQLLTPDDWVELKRLLKGRITSQLIRMKAHRLNAFLPPALREATPEDPLGALSGIRERMATSRGPTRLVSRRGYFLSSDGMSIAMLLYPVRETENARTADQTLRFLERSRDAFFEHYGAWRGLATIEFRGSLVRTARNARDIRHDFGLIAQISIPLTLLLMLLVFRKAEAMFFILLPVLVGELWTLAIATLLFGGITTVTATFMAVVGALGLEFSIHLYHRFTLELYRTRHYYRALKQSYVETARGTISSAIVLAIIFFLLFLTSLWGSFDMTSLLRAVRDVQGLGQLGLIVGLCILCCLAACLVMLPLLAAIKHAMARGRVKPVHLFRFGIGRLYEPAIQRPQVAILAMLLLAVVCGFSSRQLTFLPRFASVSSFFYRENPDGAAAAGDSGFPIPGRPMIAVVEGDTLKQALEENDRLYANLRAVADRYGILSIDSLRTILPSLKSQKESLDQLASLDLDAFRRELQSSSRLVGLRPRVYEPFLKALAAFKEDAKDPHYIRFSSAASDKLIDAVNPYVTSEAEPTDADAAASGDLPGVRYYVRTAVYPNAAGFDPAQFSAMRHDLAAGLGDLFLIGDPVIEREMAGMIKINLSLTILLSIATILAALFLHFRRARLVWLTFVPIVAEVLWMCGLMALAGLKIHFFTVLAMPLVLCLAMDNALQLTQYFSDRQPCTVRHAMLSVGRVPALVCGAVALLYGTLGLMSYPGFHDFGLTVVIGCAVVVIGNTMLQPALLQILGKGQPLAEALVVGGESEA